MYAVHRREHSYSLAVSNTGDGLEYHPQEADPGMDGYRAMHTIQLDDIEPGVLTDTSSWALLYRPLTGLDFWADAGLHGVVPGPGAPSP